MSGEASRSRIAALIGLGAVVVHEVQYLLISGSAAGEALRRDDYSGLGHVPPTLAAFAVAVIALRMLLARFGGSRPTAGADLWERRAAFLAVAIFGLYVAQEGVEATFFSQHVEGVLVVLAHGCWLSLLISVCLAPVVLTVDAWIGRLEHVVAASRLPRTTLRANARRPRPSFVLRPSVSPLAFGLARRPPPALLHR